MSHRLGPVSRRIFARKLRALGSDGPFPGSKHSFMQRGRHKVRLPNQKEIGPKLLGQLLRQAGISRDVWFDT